MMRLSLLLVFVPLESNSFTQHAVQSRRFSTRIRQTVRCSASKEDVSKDDDLIRNMATAPAYEVPNLVSASLTAVSKPSFFIRIAELSDEAESEEEKEKLAALAGNVMNALEVIMQKTDERIGTASETLQSILASAAEENGEFLVPLSEAKVADLRKAVTERAAVLDETFLSTANAWMRKCEEDKLDGMVTIIQQALQCYAGNALIGTSDSQDEAGASCAACVDEILAVDPTQWDLLLTKKLVSIGETPPPFTSASILEEVQDRIENMVLSQPAGSYAQQVQADFLRELTSRIQSIDEGSSDDRVSWE